MLNLIHGLPNAHRRSLVEDHFNSAESATHRGRVPYVPVHKLRFRREVIGNAVGVDLLGEIVKKTDFGSGGQEGVRQMRTDETCSAGDEYVFCHALVGSYQDLSALLRRSVLAHRPHCELDK